MNGGGAAPGAHIANLQRVSSVPIPDQPAGGFARDGPSRVLQQWTSEAQFRRIRTARLCRGGHLRRLSSTRFQGATLIEPDLQIYRIRLSGWLHCKAHGGAFSGKRSRRMRPPP